MTIDFNRLFVAGNETNYLLDAIARNKIGGDGYYTKKCQEYFEHRYAIAKALMTTSCTDALEMAALLMDIRPGDEVIVPSYTFVSTVNAFVLRGAKIVFADSEPGHPNIDITKIEEKITKKTKAIIPVHYSGNACKMDLLMEYARHFKLAVIEDAAHSINSFFINAEGTSIPLGSLGTFGAFSFHETKNITCGEGGLLAINDQSYIERAEIIWEKGTNKKAFLRGEIDQYDWVDMGSSFLPADILAGFLYAQLECLDEIQAKRTTLWDTYYSELKKLANDGYIQLPAIPVYTTNNAHIFYLVCRSVKERSGLHQFLLARGIQTAFHYQCLHRSKYYLSGNNESVDLPNCDKFSGQLLRLPLHCSLNQADVYKVIEEIGNYYRSL